MKLGIARPLWSVSLPSTVSVPGNCTADFASATVSFVGTWGAATVTVTAPSEALVLQADRFVAELGARPDVMLALLRSVIARLRDADRKRAEFAALPTDARIAERLIELALAAAGATDGAGAADAADGAAGPPTFPITQAELAGWVGCSREAANKALGRFADRGLVELGRGRVTILDLEGLRHAVAL